MKTLSSDVGTPAFNLNQPILTQKKEEEEKKIPVHRREEEEELGEF